MYILIVKFKGGGGERGRGGGGGGGHSFIIMGRWEMSAKMLMFWNAEMLDW